MIDPMDFLPVYKGVINILITLGVAVGTTLAPSPPTQQPALQDPGVSQTYNLPSESQTGLPEEVSPDVIIGPIQPQTVQQPKSTISPSPSPLVSSTPALTPIPASSNVPLSGNSQRLFDMVNDYRKTKGLPIFEKDEKICALTEKRAPQVNDELSSGNLHKGFKELNLPYWASENIAAYLSIEENLHFWLSDYIHKKAIESDAKFSCVSCSGFSCSQIFTSFLQK